MSEQSRTRLEERWNRAATQYCAGSEFIDYPERVFETIADRIHMSNELAVRKAALKLKVDRDELLKALKDCVQWLTAFAKGTGSETIGETDRYRKYVDAIAKAEGRS